MGLFSRDRSRDPMLTDAFARYATQNGLTHRGLFPEVTMGGVVAGAPFQFVQWEREYTSTDSDGDTHTSRAWYAEVSSHDPAWLGDLFVDAQHAIHRIANFFGAQDIKVGIPAFDDAFVVKCSDEARARRILTPAACEALRAVWSQEHRVKILNQRIEYGYAGMIEDPRQVDAMIRALTFVLASLGR